MDDKITADGQTTDNQGTVTTTGIKSWDALVSPETVKTLPESFTTKFKGKPIDDVITAHHNLEVAFSKRDENKVKIPDDKATPQEKRAFYDRLGVPKDEKGYEIERPQMPDGLAYDETFESLALKKAAEVGISKGAMKELYKAYNDYFIGSYLTRKQAAEKQLTEATAQLKTDLGDKFDAEMEIAQRFVDKGGDEFKKFIDEPLPAGIVLKNHPLFIKAMNAYGKMVLDDTSPRGGARGAGQPEGEYAPEYPKSPIMYAHPRNDEEKKAHDYFVARGHQY